MTVDEHKGKIFASLFIIANRLQVLGDRLDPEVTVKQWLLIAIMYKSQPRILSVKEIAGVLGVSHQNVMQMVRSLEKKGFVQISVDDSDRRFKRIGLTERCQEYFAARGDRELAFLHDLFGGFSEDDLRHFAALIDQFISNIMKLEARSSS
ncbi:MarR family winged helix-turn-helix transcriptional regulator [Paenibacillus phocaensis]|uniref:MarR family winged helix-turn-helix transcriptional regulator n=1 Tax=Paenibacillus phocaensis TaxID=1776378 RepID=UPI000839B359|nr:MarR family transcriptional regulator [Paenibacillus phocaensis]